jgi:hypothetical protein
MELMSTPAPRLWRWILSGAALASGFLEACSQQSRAPATSLMMDSAWIAIVALQEGRLHEPQSSSEATGTPLGIECFTRMNGGTLVTLKRTQVDGQQTIEFADSPPLPLIGVTAEGGALTLASKWAVGDALSPQPATISDSMSPFFALRTRLVQAADSLVQGEVGSGRSTVVHCLEDVRTGAWITIVASDALTSKDPRSVKGWVVALASSGSGRVIARLY